MAVMLLALLGVTAAVGLISLLVPASGLVGLVLLLAGRPLFFDLTGS